MKFNRKGKIVIILLFHCIAFLALFVVHKKYSYYGFEANIEIPQFELVSHLGNKFTREELSQNYFFLYFGFLHCYSICPKSVFTMSKIAKEIQDTDLRFAFITLDPERDDTEKLQTYVQSRDERFIALRQEELEKLAVLTKHFQIQTSRELCPSSDETGILG